MEKGIFFDKEKHIYTNSDGEIYTSGTSFIKKFTPPFDTAFWSLYKAAERLLPKPDFEELKSRYLRTENKEEFIDSVHGKIDVEALNLMIATILAEWEQKSKSSTKKGTATHDKKETALRNRVKEYRDWQNFDLRNLVNGYYPELILYNHEYKVAGMADRVRVTTNLSFTVADYKTSEKIVFDSYRNPFTKNKSMMLAPCEDLPDCNFSHYSLQLSLYAWMLEQFGFNCQRLVLIHVINERDKQFTRSHQVPYLKNHIEKMLWYSTQNLKNISVGG